MSLQALLETARRQVDATLDGLLPPLDRPPADLHAAMRYTLMAPGKRVRPILTLLCGGIFAAPRAPLLRAGCAVEMVHAASLILDDLPCMDDAALRRGRPANHIRFGESTALLAALGLLNGAFGVLAGLADLGVAPAIAAAAGRALSAAIGSDGIIAGQMVDLRAGADTDLPTLEFIHSHKTGRLFIAAAELGAILGRARARDRQAVIRFAKNLGLAFQITDDLLDAVGDAGTLGKDVRKDKGRTTFVTLCGTHGAGRLADELMAHAVEALAPLGRRGQHLQELAERIRRRVS